jgi:hypothetical protein
LNDKKTRTTFSAIPKARYAAQYHNLVDFELVLLGYQVAYLVIQLFNVFQVSVSRHLCLPFYQLTRRTSARPALQTNICLPPDCTVSLLRRSRILAIDRRRRRAVADQAALQVKKCRLDPFVIAGVGDELRRKHNAFVEALGILAVAIDKKSGVRDAKAVAAEEPLIDLHLPLVALLPLLIDGDATRFRGRPVIDHGKLAADVLPHIVDRSRRSGCRQRLGVAGQPDSAHSTM